MAAVPASGIEATVLEMVRNPQRFAGQPVTVRGTMGMIQPVGGRSPLLSHFELADAGAAVRVLTAIRPACMTGSSVVVDGRFELARSVDGLLLLNVIESTTVVCR